MQRIGSWFKTSAVLSGISRLNHFIISYLLMRKLEPFPILISWRRRLNSGEDSPSAMSVYSYASHNPGGRGPSETQTPPTERKRHRSGGAITRLKSADVLDMVDQDLLPQVTHTATTIPPLPWILIITNRITKLLWSSKIASTSKQNVPCVENLHACYLFRAGRATA